VSQIRGKFGGGIDRIAVFAPPIDKRKPVDEDDRIPSDYAVAIAGAEPRALLPFVRRVEDEGSTWEEGVTGLQPAKLVDLDGDGIDEVLWVSQPALPELVTNLDLSFFADGKHGLHTLASCSYNGCERFLPAKKCRQGTVKPYRE
jgi:hypothetical protein